MTATTPMTEELLARVSARLQEHMGMYFPRNRWSEMERGIRSAARDFEFQDSGSCVEWLLASPLSRRQIEVLASHLTVGETYFVRDKATFQAFEHRIVPELFRARGDRGERLRIWSAGCASGEEPYSIAIAFERVTGGGAAGQVTLLATDINPRSLDKAASGTYGEWSFRDAPPQFKETYFDKQGRQYKVLPRIKQQVSFSFLNLAEDAYPSLANNTNAVDVIFCRNVLMYFSPEKARQVVQKFHQCLVEGGWLVVSPCEASATLFPEFATVHFPGAIIYQKRDAEQVQAAECNPVPLASLAAPHDCSGPPPYQGTKEGFCWPSTEPGVHTADEPSAATDPAFRLEEAREQYAEGQDAPAIQVLESGAKATDGDPAAHALAARALANQGKLAEALAHCERAIERDKVHAGYHYLRATILIEQGALDSARQALKRALYLDPDLVLGHFLLANLAGGQGEAETSRRHLEIARRLLSARARDEILPDSDGVTAGRLLEIAEAQQARGASNPRNSAVTPRAVHPAALRVHARKRGAR